MRIKICQYFKPISVSLSPNTQKDDVFLAWKMILQIIFRKTDPVPEQARYGASAKQKRKTDAETLEEKFKEYLGVKYAFSFNSGRSALMAILYALEIPEKCQATNSADRLNLSPMLKKENEKGEKDEILIQAFTCNAVPNSILWSGANPVYVDIDETLNIDPEDLEKKIASKSKAIILQHTFGRPAQMEKILTLAECYNLKVIEDCAHSLGAKFKGRKVGTLGDIAFFSFGRDKVISSVYGGMVATNNPDLAEKIKEFQEKCPYPSRFWIFQQLLHPIIFSIALPTYYFLNFGKFLIWFCQKLRLLSKAVTKAEKQGKNPGYFPRRMPNALACLALNQLKKLDKFNEHRKEIAAFYDKNIKFGIKTEKESIFLKFSIFIDNQKEIFKKAKKNHILLNDGWWGSPVMPPDTDLEKMGYKAGSCPKAEKIAKTIINLPTHINIRQREAKKIIKCIESRK